MKWAYSFSDGEYWTGEFETREAAVAEATAEGYGAAEFLVGQQQPVPIPNPFDAADICERADELLVDDFEVAFEDAVFRAPKAAMEKLEDALFAVWKAWCAKNGIGSGCWYVPAHERVSPLSDPPTQPPPKGGEG